MKKHVNKMLCVLLSAALAAGTVPAVAFAETTDPAAPADPPTATEPTPAPEAPSTPIAVTPAPTPTEPARPIDAASAVSKVLNYRSYMSGKGWKKVVKEGKTSGAARKGNHITQFAALLGKKFSSSGIKYRTYSKKGWTKWASNGKECGMKSVDVQAVQIKLTGDAAKKYNVYYRVYTTTKGWLGWAKNGEKAGTAKIKQGIEAIKVVVQSKKAAAPGSTAIAFTTAERVSGNLELDNAINNVLKKIGRGNGALRRAYNYVSRFGYSSGSYAHGSNWSIPFALQMYKNKSGNCYRYAALFAWLARGLGYDARAVAGAVPSLSSGHAPHGWVEIRQGGVTYICDPDLNHEIPGHNWFMVTYGGAPTTYYR